MIDRLPRLGRVFFGAHLRMPRPTDPVLSGWHAVNCLREWRGDTHWALVASAGLELRQHLEDETDRLTTLPWSLLGEAASLRFAEQFEPPCEQLLARVDVTAGSNYQPASRIRT